MPNALTLAQLWQETGFRPNAAQERAILHVHGPLYLPAGPGSGKTRVLLWRTLNLIVFQGVDPAQIYLSTFTEKAARQLKEGLRSLLGRVTNHTSQPYDISKMYVGTVHSLCQRLLADRRFHQQRSRGQQPVLLDELSQYFFVQRRSTWHELLTLAGMNGADLNGNAITAINSLFKSYQGRGSRHQAITNLLAFFNRLSEERLDADAILGQLHQVRLPDDVDRGTLAALVAMYGYYLALLQPPGAPPRVDFSYLQQEAWRLLKQQPDSGNVFQHVIIDEYQDTNAIQEAIFFTLAQGHKNLCVVGDDDQALYRFRGATVENFVQFPERCQHFLQSAPTKIPLATNYRSRKAIVDFYTTFIDQGHWAKAAPAQGHYRVIDKEIRAHSSDEGPAVVASTCGKPEAVAAEIALFVKDLIDSQKVQDPNQIAFLFHSLKASIVPKMKEALEAVGLRVYAPRAGSFLEVEEATELFGLFVHLFGRPAQSGEERGEWAKFHEWLDRAQEQGQRLLDADGLLRRFVADRQHEIQTAAADYGLLLALCQRQGWALEQPYDRTLMQPLLATTTGLSDRVKRSLQRQGFTRFIDQRAQEGTPFTLRYILTSATSLDWSVLDLFYRFCGFAHFKALLDLAETGVDEGPICNLGLLSQYLARFIDERVDVLAAHLFQPDRLFVNIFFGSFLYALFRLGESEYENAEDPFPRGRIPFLTIHQAKGLEFPVVVLGNTAKRTNGPQRIEELLHPFLDRDGEPLERMAEYDAMRMFYVALSRAQNLLVLAHPKGQGISLFRPFKTLLEGPITRLAAFDLASLPLAKAPEALAPHNYSYTADYMLYQKCPRQYMIFRQYGFVASRSQTQMFGSLIHRTLEDLHQYLIARRVGVG